MVTALVYLETTNADGMMGAMEDIKGLFDDVTGFNGFTLKRGVEDPDRFLITADWDSVEDHQNWQRDNAKDFLGALEPFISGQPDITHFE